jgi:type IV secretion system protein VirD4
MILGRLTEKMVARRHKLLLLLDEFPKMGYMSPLEDGPSYLAGYGIRCMFIVQNLSQINDPKRYGPHNEIIPNCHLKLFFTISDYKTAEEVAKEVGPRTIQHASIHFGFKHKNSTRLQPTSAHVQNTKRDLIEPSELERLKLPKKVGDRVVAPGEYILLIFGYQAVKGIQAFCFLDPTFKKWIKIKPVDQSKALIPRALLEAKPATA